MSTFNTGKEHTQTTEMTSTSVNDSWPPTDNMSATDCNDPDQACYYAQILRIVNVLDLYLLPLISIIGFIGNVLSFVVFTTTYLRRLSSSVYLAALAVADTIFLLVLFCSSLTAVGIQVRRTSARLVAGNTVRPNVCF